LFGKPDAAPVDRRHEAGHMVVRIAQARTARSIDAPERKARVIMPISCASASPSRTTARSSSPSCGRSNGRSDPLERLQILEMPVETAARHAERRRERLRLERIVPLFGQFPRAKSSQSVFSSRAIRAIRTSDVLKIRISVH
jgi:hypothetical protein